MVALSLQEFREVALPRYTRRHVSVIITGNILEVAVELAGRLAEDVGMAVVSECLELHCQVRIDRDKCVLGAQWVGGGR